MTSASSVKITGLRQNRSLILAAVGIAVGVSALFNLFSGLITTKEISDITAKQSVVFNHMQTLDDKVSNNHNKLVNVVISVASLYKYTL